MDEAENLKEKEKKTFLQRRKSKNKYLIKRIKLGMEKAKKRD